MDQPVSSVQFYFKIEIKPDNCKCVLLFIRRVKEDTRTGANPLLLPSNKLEIRYEFRIV